MPVEKLTFIDLFSGIGGFRYGMEQAGHVCLGRCEWDKYANYSYKAMHQLTDDELSALKIIPLCYNKKGNPIFTQQQKYIENIKKGDEWFANDIRTVRAADIPHADCWCFGFPCQDISVAGKQLGFNGERSGLFYTVTKLIREQKEENKPSYLFIENVKNLLSVNKGLDFTAALVELDEIGYDAEWAVVNSADVVAQNRERIFIIGHLRGRRTAKVFPIEGAGAETNQADVKQIGKAKSDKRDNPNQYRVYDTDGIAPCLSKMDGGGRQPFIAVCKLDKLYVDGKSTSLNDATIKDIGGTTAYTVTARYYKGIGANNDNMVMLSNIPNFIPTPTDKTRTIRKGGAMSPTPKHNWDIIFDGIVIRRLTPRECFRLQTFPDELFDKAALVNSDSQLYKQAGNSVTCEVIRRIAERMRIE